MAAPEADFNGLIESMSIVLVQRKSPLAAKLSGGNNGRRNYKALSLQGFV
uniref:Uncharacterized protein n=1 Tax=Vibrio splendidus TaxID=29497 RepID=A0A0H3ZSX6_VIBSP|nr:hypothetical protein [Vibrio splendidus]AKN36999.1 hypothetical protein [Vibrio splendidus]